MDKCGNMPHGFIERGRITEIINGGYIVQSLDREGIETMPLKPTSNAAYQVNDMVYFFAFNDGSGAVICLI